MYIIYIHSSRERTKVHVVNTKEPVAIQVKLIWARPELEGHRSLQTQGAVLIRRLSTHGHKVQNAVHRGLWPRLLDSYCYYPRTD